MNRFPHFNGGRMTEDQLKSHSVLIIGEDPSVLVLLSSVLEAEGLRAVFARNGEEAVSITVRDGAFIQLVLCDIQTAGVIERMKEIRPEFPVVFFSTLVDSGVIRLQTMRKMKDGPFSHEGKSGLLETVRAALDDDATLRMGAA